VSFANGNILGVRAYASGIVEVYKNGSLIGTRDVSSWSYGVYTERRRSDDSGYIGLRTVGGPSTYYDDFGGGSLPVAYQPGNGKVLAAAYLPLPPGVMLKLAPSAERGQRPHLARAHPSAMLLTRPAGVIWRSYYYAGSTRIAMREDSDQGSEEVKPSPSRPSSPGPGEEGREGEGFTSSLPWSLSSRMAMRVEPE